MKLTILGSAAAEAVPALWCECEVCAYARRHGGKDIRRRTAYWIDADTLVDFGPDAFWQTVAFGINLTEINRVFFTHAHSDHCNPVELSWRQPGFSRVTRNLALFGSRPTYDLLEQVLAEKSRTSLAELHCDFHLLSPGDRITDGDLEITAIPATHAIELDPLNFLFCRNGRTLLIANDTGFWKPEAFDLLRDRKINAAVIDTTMALKFADHDQGHMGVAATVRFRDELRRRDLLAADARVIANHFSHNGNTIHEQLVDYFSPHEIEVGFDGMTLEV